MTHVSHRIIRLMGKWNYTDTRFMELRFEDILGNEQLAFDKIFKWYGISHPARSRAVGIAIKYTYANIQQNKKAFRATANHISKEWPVGVWKKYFTPDLKHEFKRLFQEELECLGYEKDATW